MASGSGGDGGDRFGSSGESELLLVRRLAAATRQLVGEIDLNEAIRVVAQSGVDLLTADVAVVALTEDGKTCASAVSVGVEPNLHEGSTLPAAALHGRVLESIEPVVAADHDALRATDPELAALGYHAAVAVPIRTDSELVGILSVYHRDPAAQVSEHEVNVLSALAEHAGSVIVRARAHTALAAERRRFEALLDTLPDGLAVVEDGVVTAWNRGAEDLTGLAASEVVGRPPPLQLTADERIQVLDGAGATRWIDAASRPLVDTGGAVWLLRDVTEQERLEQARNLFLATTSHELKTPLTVVKGLAITLRRHWDRLTDQQRMDSLETIERRTLHLDRLVERVLVGSRVEAGVMSFHIAPVELLPSVTDVLEGFDAVTPLHDLRADIPADFPLVAADRQALDTILGHLVDNAVKYSPRGGEVCVRSHHDGATAHITVSDEGEGFRSDLDELLKPFAQGERYTTRRVQGVGLGLYIVERLVTGLGGELSAANRPDRGAEFTFTLSLWSGTST